jgi:RecJ-like exonuclease
VADREKCPDCLGIGTIELDVYRPHGPNRDVGYIDTRKVVCEMCQGDGEIERIESECEDDG